MSYQADDKGRIRRAPESSPSTRSRSPTRRRGSSCPSGAIPIGSDRLVRRIGSRANVPHYQPRFKPVWPSLLCLIQPRTMRAASAGDASDWTSDAGPTTATRQ